MFNKQLSLFKKIINLSLVFVVLQSSFVLGMKKFNRSEYTEIKGITSQGIMPADCWTHIFTYLEYFELFTSICLINKEFYKIVENYCSYQLKHSNIVSVKFTNDSLKNKKLWSRFMKKYVEKIVQVGGQVKIKVDLNEKTLFQSLSQSQSTKSNKKTIILIKNTKEFNQVMKQIESINHHGTQKKYWCFTQLEKLFDNIRKCCGCYQCNKYCDCCFKKFCGVSLYLCTIICCSGTIFLSLLGSFVPSLIGSFFVKNNSLLGGTVSLVGLTFLVFFSIITVLELHDTYCSDSICWYCINQLKDIKLDLKENFMKKVSKIFKNLGGDEEFSQQSLV